MKTRAFLPAALCAALLGACGGQPSPEAAPSPPAAAAPASAADIDARLARFREVDLGFDQGALSARERALLAKLAQATAQLDELFWEQSDPEGLALYRKLAGSQSASDQALRRLLRINGGRYDLVDENAPFAGAPPHAPGATLFPADLTRKEFDDYVAQHPEQREALYNPYAVVRREGQTLVAVPYHVAYEKWLTPMAKTLREAADLSDDKAFARFLRMRADALLTDDYFASDIAWLELDRPKFDLIFAPYETYLDNFLGVKTSWGASVLVRNDAGSRKLEVFQKFVPEIQEALPLPAADRPSKRGQPTPMEVMEAPARGGDLRHGYQAVADNLPNDPRVHEQKGTKKIFFRNYMDARVQNIVIPIAQRLLREDQAQHATADGYLSFVMMHEVSHGIGPAFARSARGKQDIRAAIGAAYSGLEESKADIVSLYGLKWLADHGHVDAARLPEIYTSTVAGYLRTVRFGIAEAHGRGAIMQFNFLAERGAIRFDAASGRYALDYGRMPEAVTALAKELLEQEATGDRARTEAWFAKYGTMDATLAGALKRVTDIPVDFDPRGNLADL